MMEEIYLKQKVDIYKRNYENSCTIPPVMCISCFIYVTNYGFWGENNIRCGAALVSIRKTKFKQHSEYFEG